MNSITSLSNYGDNGMIRQIATPYALRFRTGREKGVVDVPPVAGPLVTGPDLQGLHEGPRPHDVGGVIGEGEVAEANEDVPPLLHEVHNDVPLFVPQKTDDTHQIGTHEP